LKLELEYEGTDWDEIYYEFQSAGISDPRFYAENFDDQPINVIAGQLKSLRRRDGTIANSHSIAIARCGLLFGGSDKLNERDFLPFPELLELGKDKAETLSIEAAKAFMSGIKSGLIPPKVMGAASKYMDTIIKLGST
jgi:hypothetical protein